MKRKSLMRVLSVALAVTMIVTPAAGADVEFEASLDSEEEIVSGVEDEIAGTAEDEEPVEETGVLQEEETVTAGALTAGGWNETIYATVTGVKDADVTAVSWSGTGSGSLTGDDLTYLVRDDKNGGVRIDIPGLAAGTYSLSVTAGGTSLEVSGIKVRAYDRSGFAHFESKADSKASSHGDGVGAYKDDGTIKSNAKIIYVTDENKNKVSVESKDGTTVTGIGNILNSVGQDNGSGTTGNGGTPNSNKGIIQKLAADGTPLVVRFIGCVSETGLYETGTYNAADNGLIDGLTDYNTTGNGGSVGDNGHMARIQSGKDITLEGIGYDATIDGWGFHYIAQTSTAAQGFGQSFEVRNLTFINTPEDAVGMEGQQASKNASSDLSASVERCWVHHNEFYCPHISSPAESDKSEGDGSVDFKRGQFFTCSYNYFEGCHKTNLVGSADYSLQFNLSYHHNHWFMCKVRGPLTRRANVHMYNNIFDLQTDYAQNTRADAYIFSEYNLFYACKSPQAVEGGAIKSYNDQISSVIWNKGTPGTVVADKSEKVANACKFAARSVDYSDFDTDSDKSYIPGGDYELETDLTSLRKTLAADCGAMDITPVEADAVAAEKWSIVPKAKTDGLNALTLPYTTAPGKVSKNTFVFKTEGRFNISVTYADAAKAGVLVNEAGENILEGSGAANNLPAGIYMIQPVLFQPGSYENSSSTCVWKEFTISDLNIEMTDPNAHYHKWVLDATASTPAGCTTTGTNVYNCEVTEPACDQGGRKTETVPALGHSWGSWSVVTPATETEDGVKQRVCSRCKTVDSGVIPKGESGTGGGGGSVAAGDYVLYFKDKAKVDEKSYFTVAGSITTGKGGSVTVNDETYDNYLKMDSKGSVKFSSGEGSGLFMQFSASNAGQNVKVDDTAYTIGSDGTVTVSDLGEGEHVVARDSKELYLFYVSVSNQGSSDVSYASLTLDYNTEDDLAERLVTVPLGYSFESLSDLVPADFRRSGYTLEGLYEDDGCTEAVSFPYSANSDATLFAKWTKKEGSETETYMIFFDTCGGLPVATAQVESDSVHVLDETTSRGGYAFAGWYSAAQGGEKLDQIDGSLLTGNTTVYAHWNVTEAATLTLDCANDLTAGDITADTTVNGFTLHALSGTDGGSLKYYMTVKDKKLYTNGVILTDTAIPGNEQGILKSIEFTTKDDGTLVANVALSGNPETGKTYRMVLAKKSETGSFEEIYSQDVTQGKTLTDMSFPLDGAGTYIVYADGAKGVMYSSLKVTENVYTVYAQGGAGEAEGDLPEGTEQIGDKVILPNMKAPAGQVFLGWKVEGKEEYLPDNTYIVDDEDAKDAVIVITAYYEKDDSSSSSKDDGSSSSKDGGSSSSKDDGSSSSKEDGSSSSKDGGSSSSKDDGSSSSKDDGSSSSKDDGSSSSKDGGSSSSKDDGSSSSKDDGTTDAAKAAQQARDGGRASTASDEAVVVPAGKGYALDIEKSLEAIKAGAVSGNSASANEVSLTLTMAKGDKVQLPGFEKKSSALNVDKKVASVSGKGVLKAKKETAGTTLTYVQTGTNRKISLKLVVTVPEVSNEPVSAGVSGNAAAAVNVTVKKLTVQTTGTGAFDVHVKAPLTIKVVAGKAKVKGIEFSDSTNFVTVDEKGNLHITGKVSGKGSATIPLTVYGKKYTVKIKAK